MAERIKESRKKKKKKSELQVSLEKDGEPRASGCAQSSFLSSGYRQCVENSYHRRMQYTRDYFMRYEEEERKGRKRRQKRGDIYI